MLDLCLKEDRDADRRHRLGRGPALGLQKEHGQDLSLHAGKGILWLQHGGHSMDQVGGRAEEVRPKSK